MKHRNNNESVLAAQVRHVADKTHALLDGPSGNGQRDGSYPIERLVLNVPLAATYQAAYLAQLQQSPGIAVAPGWEEGFFNDRKGTGRILHHKMRQWFLHGIWNEMHEDLHLLSRFEHPLLMDDELPF